MHRSESLQIAPICPARSSPAVCLYDQVALLVYINSNLKNKKAIKQNKTTTLWIWLLLAVHRISSHFMSELQPGSLLFETHIGFEATSIVFVVVADVAESITIDLWWAWCLLHFCKAARRYRLWHWDWLQWLEAEQGAEPDPPAGRYQTLSVSNLVLDWRHPALLAVVQALGHTVHASVEGHGRVPLTVQRDDQAGHLLVHFLWSLNRESREHVKELGGETQCLTCFLPKKWPQQPEHWAPVQ